MAVSRASTKTVCSALAASAITIVLAGETSAMAQEYRFPVDTYKSGPAATLRETPNMKLGSKAAPWFPRTIETLKANRPPRFKLETVALLKGSQDIQYLAVKWGGLDLGSPIVEFHKLVPQAGGSHRLYFMRALGDDIVHIRPPTGQTVFRGEPTIAVVDLGSGGSGVSGYRLRLIQLARNTVDITPDWAGRVVDVVDLNGDGQFEVVAIDDRWAGFFDGRGSAGPHLPIVLERKNRQFKPACAAYGAIYRKEIGLLNRKEIGLLKGYAEERTAPDPRKAEFLAGAMLAAAQIRWFVEADRLMSALKVLYADTSWGPHDTKAPTVISEFARVLTDARRYQASPCAAMATGSRGGHHGFQRRAEQFRFKKR